MRRRAPADWAFTCLVPVHGKDDAEHFRAALRSIGEATLAPTETLICQDGPLSPALQAAIRVLVRTPGVRVTTNPGPQGLHHNLNSAIEQVRTPWVARADADDLNLPRRFESQVRFARENPRVAVLGGGIVEFWPDGRERRKAMPQTHDEIVRRARWRNPINHMTAFFRTDAFRACGGYPNISMKEDYALWLTMIGKGFLLANLSQDLVRARLGDDFHRRRSGWRNLSSEYALYRLKRGVPRIGGASALAALAARVAALAFAGPAAVVYERALR